MSRKSRGWVRFAPVVSAILLLALAPRVSADANGRWKKLHAVARHSHAAVLDPSRDRMLVIGGFDGAGVSSEVRTLPLGSPTWDILRPGGAQAPRRMRHSAILDPVRDRVLVFGGSDGGQSRNDVWQLSLSGVPAWTMLVPSGTPPTPRAGHAAIYDPVNDRMLVFGGTDAGPGVWALSLSGEPQWSPVAASGTPPPAWDGSAAIHDPLRNRMLVFGGADGSGALHAGVWALDLAGAPSWSAVATVGMPPSGRYSHTAIYDGANDRLIAFGGWDGAARNDSWALALAGTPAWAELSPEGVEVAGRLWHSAILDAARQRMVVFGGSISSSPMSDIAVLSLSASPEWSVLLPDGDPPVARRQHTAIYDPVRDRLIVFGGPTGDAQVYAVPLVGPAVWARLEPTGGPPTWREGHTAIYDPPRDRMIVFGGHGATGFLGDVWELSLSGDPHWATIVPAGTTPGARAGHAAIYDPVGDRMVVTGGMGPIAPSASAWALSLGESPAWTPLDPSGTDPATFEHSAIYDPVRHRLVSFAGFQVLGWWVTPSQSVHALSLGESPSWTSLSPAGPLPGPRTDHSAVYDPLRDRMVVWGGANVTVAYAECWQLSFTGQSSTWSPLVPVGPGPEALWAHTALLDPIQDRMILFGGGAADATNRADLWALEWREVVAVPPAVPPAPGTVELAAPWPNPSSGGVRLSFGLPRASRVSLVVHDLAGRRVRVLADAMLEAGRHAVTWDRRNESGNVVGSGIYFVRLTTPGTRRTGKVALIR